MVLWHYPPAYTGMKPVAGSHPDRWHIQGRNRVSKLGGLDPSEDQAWLNRGELGPLTIRLSHRRHPRTCVHTWTGFAPASARRSSGHTHHVSGAFLRSRLLIGYTLRTSLMRISGKLLIVSTNISSGTLVTLNTEAHVDRSAVG